MTPYASAVATKRFFRFVVWPISIGFGALAWRYFLTGRPVAGAICVGLIAYMGWQASNPIARGPLPPYEPSAVDPTSDSPLAPFTVHVGYALTIVALTVAIASGLAYYWAILVALGSKVLSGALLALAAGFIELRPVRKPAAEPNSQAEPTSQMDAFITAVYGNPPPPKTADTTAATRIAHEELLLQIVPREAVAKAATELAAGPVPYSTHDLALSTALQFFKRPDMVPRLHEAQLVARLKSMEWLREGSIVPPLAQAFEDVLYRLYKPTA